MHSGVYHGGRSCFDLTVSPPGRRVHSDSTSANPLPSDVAKVRLRVRANDRRRHSHQFRDRRCVCTRIPCNRSTRRAVTRNPANYRNSPQPRHEEVHRSDGQYLLPPSNRHVASMGDAGHTKDRLAAKRQGSTQATRPARNPSSRQTTTSAQRLCLNATRRWQVDRHSVK
jgi:hypothetical protein